MTSTQYKKYRLKLGTQAEVAAMLGVSREVVARRETGAKITREAEYALRWIMHKALAACDA